jgi:hypothetical protein
MFLTRRVLGKVALANGPIAAPKNLGGDLTQQIVSYQFYIIEFKYLIFQKTFTTDKIFTKQLFQARSVVIGMAFATPFYLWHFYTFRVVGGNALIERITVNHSIRIFLLISLFRTLTRRPSGTESESEESFILVTSTSSTRKGLKITFKR